ncbi:unnamed protein product [Macrosiphum euphorbiae]|uniref:Uncharacterized protein n=1 Tax=Macrosiphum euphorbiae TaxID=13131 RepID=A0AAV0Y1Z1_9HEMI|nr:unnamed protein product [Macrosiphum euphorbiae]CAI6374875.1 unnamed protein product [Macrosiphum euphorbiae]
MQNFRRDIIKQWMSEAKKRTSRSVSNEKIEDQENFSGTNSESSHGDGDNRGPGSSRYGDGNEDNEVSELESVGDGQSEQGFGRGGGSPQFLSTDFPDTDQRIFSPLVGNDYFCNLSTESRRNSYSSE